MIRGVIGENDKSIRETDLTNVAARDGLHAGGPALSFEHAEDVACGPIAEKLAKSFLMIGNAVFFHQGDEVGGRESRQRGFREVRIRGNKIFRAAMKIREIAAASSGD